MEELVKAGEQAIHDGASLLIVSDRDIGPKQVAIPSLLATSALHHGLLERRLRSAAGILVESGEPREVMHFCLLSATARTPSIPTWPSKAFTSYGPTATCRSDEPVEHLIDHYISAVKKGILKTMSKMGISTLRSYHSAQQFEAVGLNREFINEYFRGTASRIEGVGIECHRPRGHWPGTARALAAARRALLDLDHGGEYQYRLDGERHFGTRTTVTTLQHAVMKNDQRLFDEFVKAVNEQAKELCTLRGHVRVRARPAGAAGRSRAGQRNRQAVQHRRHVARFDRRRGPPDAGNRHEPAGRQRQYGRRRRGSGPLQADGQRRFAQLRHQTGGQRTIRRDDRISGQRQDPANQDGPGGQARRRRPASRLQGDRRNRALRHATAGVSLISPPPHHDIYSIEDLAQLIYDLKCANPGGMVSVKLVSEVGVGTVASGVAKGYADEVLISGHDGGTGASPLVVNQACGHAVGDRAGRDAADARSQRPPRPHPRAVRRPDADRPRRGDRRACSAPSGSVSARRHWSRLGCILMRKCHLGTCPVGIATQDPDLRKRFHGKAEYVVRFLTFVAEDIRREMAQLGFRKFDDMVGHVERLGFNKAINHWKAKGLDFSGDLRQAGSIQRLPSAPRATAERHAQGPSRLVDHRAARRCLAEGKRTQLEMPIRNVNRTVGAILSNRIVKFHGGKGLPDGTFDLTFTGSAGQSFGHFWPRA